MLKQRVLLLLALCFAAPAQAGLFSDDEARKQIQQLEERMLKLEGATEHQTKAILDLLSQIEELNGEIRRLRGRNEELSHGLQDAEKREKDFYVDLDTRLRRFEPIENGPHAGGDPTAEIAPVETYDPVRENRAFEAAYGLFKGGSHENAVRSFQEFIQRYPESVHVPNAHYGLGNAQLALKDFQGALDTYQGLLKASPSIPVAADVLFGIAECQQGLSQSVAAKKTLKRLVAKYPDSEAAGKAKELLATFK